MKKVFLIVVLCMIVTVSYAYGRAADTGEDLVEVDFMAEVLEDILLDSLVDAVLVVISEVDGTEEAVIGEDGAITRTEHMATPTSVFVRIHTTLPGIGLRNVIPMAGATEFGYRIIEGKGYFLTRAYSIHSPHATFHPQIMMQQFVTQSVKAAHFR